MVRMLEASGSHASGGTNMRRIESVRREKPSSILVMAIELHYSLPDVRRP
jgi:hypothetical protein